MTIRVNVRMSAEQVQELRELSVRFGAALNLSDAVRMAINDFLVNNRPLFRASKPKSQGRKPKSPKKSGKGAA